MREDFSSVGSIGPRRTAEFLGDGTNEDVAADAWGAIQDLLAALPD